jgi:hypothetical protein
VPESSQVLEKVFAHLRANDAGIKEIINSTHLTSDEFSRHVFGLVRTVNRGSATGLAATARQSREHIRLVSTQP